MHFLPVLPQDNATVNLLKTISRLSKEKDSKPQHNTVRDIISAIPVYLQYPCHVINTKEIHEKGKNEL